MALLQPNKISLVHKNFLEKKFNKKNINFITVNNINFNYDVKSDLINRVRIWYLPDGSYLCATKELNNSQIIKKNIKFLAFKKQFEQHINMKIFSDFEIFSVDGADFIVEEFLHHKTLEELLKDSISSPERSFLLYKKNLEKIFNVSHAIFKAAKSPKKYNLSKGLNYFIEKYNPLSARINKVKSILTKTHLTSGMVIPDLVTPNIFSNGILIDNIPSSYKNLMMIPNECNVYRFLFLISISPPMRDLIGSPILFIISLVKKNTKYKSILLSKFTNYFSDSFSLDEHLSLFYLAILYEFNERMIVFSGSPRENDIKEEFLKYLAELDNLNLFKIAKYDDFLYKREIGLDGNSSFAEVSSILFRNFFVRNSYRSIITVKKILRKIYYFMK